MNMRFASAALLALAATGAAWADDSVNWHGFYFGGNLGGAWSTTCNTWTATGPAGTTTAFNDRDCPNKGVFVGGGQLGYNFQSDNWVFGLEADYDFWGSKSLNRSRTYSGTEIPAGTYAFSYKVNPDGFLIVGPRVGYAVDRWLPYLRAGGVYTTGTTDVLATFTPAGGSAATSTFNGGKNTHSHGYGISLGTEYAMDDNWSFKAEYTYVDLGKGSNATSNCSGDPATCAAFVGTSLDSIHNNFTASMFRIGFNYRFAAPVVAAAMVAAPMAAPVVAPVAAPVAVAAAPKDSDGDGVPDSADQCPNTPKGERVGPYGCSCDITRQVEFAFDSAELTAAGKATLDELSATLTRLKFVSGTVEGHTDNKGTPEYNQGLSERRAKTVADYLEAKGVASHRLAVKGMGESNPIADNSTEEGRAKNRRVVLRRTDCDAGR